jgi:hypothetical protein
MMKYVDKVIQMVDGQIARVITNPESIQLLAGTSKFNALDLPTQAPIPQSTPIQIPVFPDLVTLPVSGD